MKVYILLGALFISFPLPVKALTARQYFDELHGKNTFFDYKYKYVCFPDEEVGSFSVLAITKDIKNIKKTVRYEKKRESIPGVYLVEKVYTKGESSEQNIYKKTDENDEVVWLMKQSPLYQAKSIYAINWTTGRYRLLIYAVEHNDGIPSYTESGNCELIQSISKR